MKSFIVAIVVAALLAAGSVWHRIYVGDTTEEIIMNAEQVAAAMAEQDFQAARDYVDTLREKIVKEENMLGVICDHKDYYEIKRAIGELEAFVEKEDVGESLAHCAAIVIMTERINEISKPYISNIL